MALKAVLDSVDGLPDAVKSEYKKGEDGKFHLDIDGFDNHPSAVKLKDDFKRAKDHEKGARQAAETKLKEIQTSLDTLTEERDNLLRGAIPKGDVEKLETSYKDKIAKREKELTSQIDGLSGQLNELLVDNVASRLATEISKSPTLMLPHIRSRLKVEKDETSGKLVTRVVDKEGKPSALTIDDLKKEVIANPEFAAVIIGSKASGGGAGGGNGGGGAPNGQIDFSKASPKEIAAHIKAKKESGV